MRPATTVLLVLATSATFATAQGTECVFEGDYRLGHRVAFASISPTAYAFLDVMSFGQSTWPTWTPFGTYHLDLVNSSVFGVPAVNGVGTYSFFLPVSSSFVGVRVFGQSFGLNDDLSTVADFVVCGLQEDFAERNGEQWFVGADDETSASTVTEDTVLRAVGTNSVRWDSTAPFNSYLRFPANRNGQWYVGDNTHLEFLVRVSNPNVGFQGPQPVVRIGSGNWCWVEYRPTTDLLTPLNHLNGWTPIRIPLAGDANWTRTTHGCNEIFGVDWIEIAADTWNTGFTLWVDGLCFTPAGVPRPYAPSLQESDLDVTRIERFPHYLRYAVSYDPVSGNPYLTPGTEGEKRWPDPGEPVVFRADIKNAGRRDTSTFQVFWFVDDLLVATHTRTSLVPGARVIDEFQWNWQPGRHWIRCRVAPIDGTRQVTEMNDHLEIETDALTFGFTMEQATYDALNAVPNVLGSYSAEDWLNGQLQHMNEMFRDSTYQPFAPHGAMQRVRMDKLTVVPSAGTVPEDREVDGQWTFPASSAQEYRNYATRPAWALLHELSHQLGVIDLYQMNLEPANNLVNGRGFVQTNPGIMGGGTIESHTGGLFYASHDVFGLNATLGFRRGHYGEYLYKVPASVEVELREGATVLGNVPVRIFQKDKATGQVDNVPEITGTTSALGRLLLPNRTVVPVTTATGATLGPNPWGQVDVVGRNGLFLVEAATPAGLRYGFFTIQDANLEYARGNTTACLLTVQLLP